MEKAIKVNAGKRKSWESCIKKDDYILDIGCWSGEKVLDLSKEYKNVYGMDIDNSKIDLADSKVKRKLKLGDVTKKIPFKYKFDWIMLSEVLEHIPDDEVALKNINKSLKIGGKLIITTPKSVSNFEVWDPAWIRWKLIGGEKHFHFTKEELFSKLHDKGFEISEYYIVGDLLWLVSRWIRGFVKYILRTPTNFSFRKNESNGFFDWIILAKKVKELK